ncbi:MAG: M48 family metallopeptidase [Gammaproteobacteria bacterium]|nr:M48 family metallopeptidase [Gammaproteobacteria bacterium]
MNLLTAIFLVFAFAGVATQWLLVRRHAAHIGRHRDRVPDAFEERIPLADHQKAADYTCAKARTGLVELVFGAVVVLAWTLGGGLRWLDQYWRALQLPELWTGVGFLASVVVIGGIIDVPFSAYRTFGLEQRFGFNRMTPRLFITDLLKQALLLLVIGLPMTVLVLWIMDTGRFWWLGAWLCWFAFSLAMMWAYPAFIAPLFNKFRPLENEALRRRIEDLLTRNGFASRGIFVMDGSARSTHGNAYFAGMGTSKRIVFFDTLVDDLSHAEIEAVLAHELGHFKCRHIGKRMATMAVVVLAGLALLAWLVDEPWFYAGLRAGEPSNYLGLTLLLLIAPVFTFFLQPVFSYISRRHEFEADEFAARQAQTENLIHALVKLYRENSNTLTPDPLYSAFHDSHPPAPTRIAHLAAL